MIDRVRSFHIARWSLETGTSVPVAPVWTRATGHELVAIDRARFGKMSCGHGLSITTWCLERYGLLDDGILNWHQAYSIGGATHTPNLDYYIHANAFVCKTAAYK